MEEARPKFLTKINFNINESKSFELDEKRYREEIKRDKELMVNGAWGGLNYLCGECRYLG